MNNIHVSMEESSSSSPAVAVAVDPPFLERYKSFITKKELELELLSNDDDHNISSTLEEYCKLPLIDLKQLLNDDNNIREKCKKEIAKASTEWGFFQVINHGISHHMLHKMRCEQVKLLTMPFQDKDRQQGFLAATYRWGTPSATCLNQVAWSEAFHVPLTAIISAVHRPPPPSSSYSLPLMGAPNTSTTSIRSTMEELSREMFELAQKVAEILAERLDNENVRFFRETCSPSSCYLRMNRYPACPKISKSHIFGLMPHTDSDFITVLHQDEEIGGLQLLRDGKWLAVKPRPQALIINIGDLFQAWSNGVYKSVEHRVVANTLKERFSIAFFMCPSYETLIVKGTCVEPSLYTRFTFKDYRDQVQEDVTNFGHKFGLTRFLR